MNLRFLGQPFQQHDTLVDFIEHARSGGFDELRIAVAWAKRSGLGRIWDALDDFRTHGGTVTLVVGVSEGGATKEGLELAMAIADHSYVFHDPRRTFHPKVYLASSAGPRSLLVGSSNLTAGGLSWNYEASIWTDWDAGEGIDVTDSVVTWFDELITSQGSCSPLTTDLIKHLEQSTDIMLGSEARSRRVQSKQSDTPEDSDSEVAATISGLFKPLATGLRKLPGLSAKIPPLLHSTRKTATRSGGAKGTSATVQRPTGAGGAPLALDDVKRRWVKKLDHTAAQQAKSAQTKRTGNLRLSREKAPIEHKTYFREDFFENLPWAPTTNKVAEQEVMVAFRTWIDGNDLGTQELRISHDPGRISGQGNVPTVLHWGSLAPTMRSTNYVGYYVNLESTRTGSFNLVISQAARGDYLP